MIRAKNEHGYVYIYSKYTVSRFTDNQTETLYLCSVPYHVGLIALKEDEIFDIVVLKDNYIHLSKIESGYRQNDIMHPVLYDIYSDNWENYESIVEGVYDAWLLFEEKLGHRP